MTDCAILGDSLAVGVGQHRPDCAVVAKVGAASSIYVGRSMNAEAVLISLGSNDSGDFSATLEKVRAGITARRVVWLLPALRAQRQVVIGIAARYGDDVLSLRHIGPDGVHPDATEYREIARVFDTGGRQ